MTTSTNLASPDLARFSGQHFLHTLDYSVSEIAALVDLAAALKANPLGGDLSRRLLGLLFFNPSVRTRVSCEAAMARLGGSACALLPGKDTWQFESGEGVVMDGATQEHLRELAPVLGRMCDVVGIRKSELITTGLTGSSLKASYSELAANDFLAQFASYSTVPVINLESNLAHPLQGLADMLTIRERLGLGKVDSAKQANKQKYVLTWAWHPKSLPVATPHSQLLAAADSGMECVVLRPEGWELASDVMQAAKQRAESLGGSVTETDDVQAAYEGAHVVCAKSWGSLDYYGRFDEEALAKQSLRTSDWIVDGAKMARTQQASFMHCLPVRRNVIVTDEVIDSRESAVIDQAENRLWTVAAVLCAVAGGLRSQNAAS